MTASPIKLLLDHQSYRLLTQALQHARSVLNDCLYADTTEEQLQDVYQELEDAAGVLVEAHTQSIDRRFGDLGLLRNDLEHVYTQLEDHGNRHEDEDVKEAIAHIDAAMDALRRSLEPTL